MKTSLIAQLELNIGEAAQRQDLPGSDVSGTEGVTRLISSFLNIAMAVGSLLLLGYLIWGALDWLNSGGDSSKIEKARQKMMHAIIGVVILAASVAIFMLVQQFLGIEVLNFG